MYRTSIEIRRRAPSLRAVFASCLLGFMLLTLAGCGRSDSQSTRPDLLLISIDTLRADHLGCYGYARQTSPFLDRLVKREGVLLFEQCIAQSSTTAPSHMSLLTSLFPSVHGVPNIPFQKDVGSMVLPGHTRTLAQVLQDAGYHTGAVVDGGYLEPVFGFKPGFDTYDCKYEGASRKVDKAMAWLQNRPDRDKPYFLFMHTYEVHAPYLPPSPYKERFTGRYNGWIRDYCSELETGEEQRLDGFAGLFKKRQEFSKDDVDYLVGLYDGGIAYMDAELERLWRFLDDGGYSRDLIVVIVSDHGEEFGEHGEFSHKNLYDCVVHVPLVMALPPALRTDHDLRRIPQQACLIDVMPTLLDLLKIPAPPYLQGRSLAPLFRGEGFDQPAYSEVIDFGQDPLCHSVRQGRCKLLNYASGQYFELFDLEADKAEKNNCASIRQEMGKPLLQLLKTRRETDAKMRDQFRAHTEAGRLPLEVKKNLRALGY